MKYNIRVPKAGGSSVGLGITIGVFAACLAGFLLTIALTSLVMNGSVDKNETDLFVFVIRAISVILGSLITTSFTKTKHLLMIGLTMVGYLLIQLILGFVIFNDSFHNFGIGVISTLLGGVCACIIKLKMPLKKKHFVKHRR